MKHSKRWTALGVTAAAVPPTLTASGTAWASGPSGHARPVAASSRQGAPLGGAAACERMMRGHPEMQGLHHQMMRGSPDMAAMRREMMSGAAGMMDTGPTAGA